MMDYVRLGNTGLKVSRLCLGTMTYGTPAWRPWVLDEAASRPFIARALEHGINFFDTADVYSRGASEQVLGRALKDQPRDRLVIATKAFYPVTDGPNSAGLSRKHLLDAIDGSLRRLGTDYVDLYQLHGYDRLTPIDEALEALDTVVRTGKARYVGVSNWPSYNVARSLGRSEVKNIVRIDSVQPRYNLLFRSFERDLLPLCAEDSMSGIP